MQLRLFPIDNYGVISMEIMEPHREAQFLNRNVLFVSYVENLNFVFV